MSLVYSRWPEQHIKDLCSHTEHHLPGLDGTGCRLCQTWYVTPIPKKTKKKGQEDEPEEAGEMGRFL